jgi:hypothetical protein
VASSFQAVEESLFFFGQWAAAMNPFDKSLDADASRVGVGGEGPGLSGGEQNLIRKLLCEFVNLTAVQQLQ